MKTLRIKELEEKLSVKKSKIYLLVNQGLLPRPKKIGTCSVWLEDEVEAAFIKLVQGQSQDALNKQL